MRRLAAILALALAAGIVLGLLGAWYFGPDASHTYRVTAGEPLQLHVYGDRPTDAPALVLFHGGGWTYGSPLELAPLAWLFSRGQWRVILPEYRLAASHGTDALDALDDARAAVAWIRAHASRLGIDPERLVLGGASAGAQLAAATAMAAGATAARGLLLLAPVTDTSAAVLERRPRLSRLFRGRGQEVSPIHLIRADAPATLILHGSADGIIPLEASEAFCAAMARQGAPCRTVVLDGGSHRFFKLPWNWRWVVEQSRTLLEELAVPPRRPY